MMSRSAAALHLQVARALLGGCQHAHMSAARSQLAAVAALHLQEALHMQESETCASSRVPSRAISDLLT